MTRAARIASRPAFDSVMMPVIVSPSMIGAANVRWSMPRMPASSTKRVGDELESFRVELERQRLALGNRRAHLVRTRLELATDAVGLDRLLVAVPRHALDADGGDVAAEATESFDKRHLDAGPGGGKGGREPGRAGTDDQHIGLVDDVDLASRLRDRAERSAAAVALVRSTVMVCSICRLHLRCRGAFMPRSPPVHPYTP